MGMKNVLVHLSVSFLVCRVCGVYDIYKIGSYEMGLLPTRYNIRDCPKFPHHQSNFIGVASSCSLFLFVSGWLQKPTTEQRPLSLFAGEPTTPHSACHTDRVCTNQPTLIQPVFFPHNQPPAKLKLSEGTPTVPVKKRPERLWPKFENSCGWTTYPAAQSCFCSCLYNCVQVRWKCSMAVFQIVRN